MKIEHNPNERRPTNTIWWVLWAVVVLQWIAYFYFRDPDWWSIAIGAFSMGVLATFAIEISGNQRPGLGQRKPPRP